MTMKGKCEPTQDIKVATTAQLQTPLQDFQNCLERGKSKVRLTFKVRRTIYRETEGNVSFTTVIF